ncbi:MAG: MarR family transcriptional regulator [Chloroflexota bacterium]
MAPLELVPKQFIALEFIANNPNLSQKEIANYIGTTAPMMVHVLDSLSQRGLVQRVRSEKDRRKQNIQLTAAGSALLAEIRTRALEADRLLLAEANLSESDKETLLQLLRRLTNREFNESQTSP